MMTLRRTLHSIVAIAGAVMAKDKAEPPIARISLGRQPQCRASEARTEVRRNSERTRSPNAQSRGALLVVTVRRLSDRSGDDGVDKVRASTSFRSDSPRYGPPNYWRPHQSCRAVAATQRVPPPPHATR